jgi:hypothetical protein
LRGSIAAVKYPILFLVAVLTATVAPRIGCAAPASGQSADQLFAAGKFDEAAAAYRELLLSDPNASEPMRRLGTIELYRNDLDAASNLLTKAQRLDPASAPGSAALAEIQRRRSEAAKRVQIDGGEAVVPFVATDPLPSVRVRLNGNRDATFVIDTGAPDIVLSAALAKRLGVKTSAAGEGVFAGGRRAPVEKGMVDSIALGGATAYDVAATVGPVLQFGPDQQIEGIVGTGLLARFLATLDYPHGRLILRPRNQGVSDAFERAARDARASVVPCWLAGDHFVFATAQVNDTPKSLFLFDSGLAGGGLMPSSALVDAAHIVLDRAHAGTGMGGGGEVQAIPFTATSVSVGDAIQHDVPGIYSPQGSPFAFFPFTVAGAVSHEFLKHYAYTVDFDAMKLVLSG